MRRPFVTLLGTCTLAAGLLAPALPAGAGGARVDLFGAILPVCGIDAFSKSALGADIGVDIVWHCNAAHAVRLTYSGPQPPGALRITSGSWSGGFSGAREALLPQAITGGRASVRITGFSADGDRAQTLETLQVTVMLL